jgi:hypothetical protein
VDERERWGGKPNQPMYKTSIFRNVTTNSLPLQIMYANKNALNEKKSDFFNLIIAFVAFLMQLK